MSPSDRPPVTTRFAQSWRERTIVLKALSFGLIGLINSAVDFGVFALAFYYFGRSILVAQIIAWVVAVTGSYVMNSTITFAAESGGRLGARAFASFVLAQVAGFLANTATVYLVSYVLELVAGIGEGEAVLVGKLLAIGASFAVNFSLSHFVVFRRR
jgi:putative flippase GtrA